METPASLHTHSDVYKLWQHVIEEFHSIMYFFHHLPQTHQLTLFCALEICDIKHLKVNEILKYTKVL